MKAVLVIVVLVGLSGCTAVPSGPTVSVLPAPGKPLERFAEEDAYCKQFARQQVVGAPEQANNQVIGSAVVGTILGTALGAAIGGGQGAGIGAAAGTLLGTGTASGNSAWTQMSIQQRYNIAYMQCMYAKGNQVPGYTVVALPYPPPPPAVVVP